MHTFHDADSKDRTHALYFCSHSMALPDDEVTVLLNGRRIPKQSPHERKGRGLIGISWKRYLDTLSMIENDFSEFLCLWKLFSVDEIISELDILQPDHPATKRGWMKSEMIQIWFKLEDPFMRRDVLLLTRNYTECQRHYIKGAFWM